MPAARVSGPFFGSGLPALPGCRFNKIRAIRQTVYKCPELNEAVMIGLIACLRVLAILTVAGGVDAGLPFEGKRGFIAIRVFSYDGISAALDESMGADKKGGSGL